MTLDQLNAQIRAKQYEIEHQKSIIKRKEQVVAALIGELNTLKYQRNQLAKQLAIPKSNRN